MVAQIMFFALGFLTAGLIALIIFPAFNARATRLAKRRVEALLPVSLAEIAAERDFLRAENALAQNRKDKLIARKDEALQHRMVEVGKGITEIAWLNAELTTLREQLADEESKLQTANEQIGAFAEKLRKAAMNNNAEDHSMSSDQERIAQLETELAALEQELAAQRAVVEDQETRLSQKAERIIALQQEALHGHSNGDLSRRIEELADSIMADASEKLAQQKVKQTQQADLVQVGRLPARETNLPKTSRH